MIGAQLCLLLDAFGNMQQGWFDLAAAVMCDWVYIFRTKIKTRSVLWMAVWSGLGAYG